MKEIKKVMEENKLWTHSLSHFGSGWIQFCPCIRRTHTHTRSHTHTSNKQTHIQIGISPPGDAHPQIIHFFRKGWVRLQKCAHTGSAHAPFHTFEWVIGCTNGQRSHLSIGLWTMFCRGGCTTLHTDLTAIRLHYIASLTSPTSCSSTANNAII